MKQTKKTIIYDDTCPMCIAVVNEVDDSAKGGTFALKGTTKSHLPSGVTRQQVQKEIHVIDQDGTIHRNVDAMLQIVEEYPRWRFLVPLARLPGIYQLLQLMYKVIAANRHLIFGPGARIYWLKNVVILGALLGMVLSLPLWAGWASYPAVPLLDFTPQLPVWTSTIVTFAVFAAFLGGLISPRPRVWILGAIAGTATLVCFDQNRLQPWLYQYAWMLAVLALYSWKGTQQKSRHIVLQTLRIIVASIYFFSGVQKINPDFMTNVFPWMVQPVTTLLPGARSIIESTGVIVPFIELAIGLMLFVPKFRKAAVIMASAMAVGILLLIGPLGHGWNYVVWPWNVVMPLATALLFWHTEKITLKDVLKVKGFLLHKIVIVMFIILPLLSFCGKWDSYLSWTLYSGNTTRAVILFTGSDYSAVPGAVQKYVEQTPGGLLLNVQAWSVGEEHVPPYPETRVFKAVTRDVCMQAVSPQDIKLIIFPKPLHGLQKQETYYCSDL